MDEAIYKKRNPFSFKIQSFSKEESIQESSLVYLFFIPLFLYTQYNFQHKPPHSNLFQLSAVTGSLNTKKKENSSKNTFLNRGKKLFKQRKFKQSERFFKKEIKLKQNTTAIATIYLSLSLNARGEWKEAYKLLNNIQNVTGVTKNIIEKSLVLMWKIVTKNWPDNWIEQMRVQAQIIEYTSSTDKIDSARDIVKRIIKNKNILEDSELENLDFNPVRDLILFEKGVHFLKQGEPTQALDSFRSVLSYSSNNTALEEKTKNLIRALEARTKVNTNTIGVVLPLSGPYKKIGMKCLNGMKLGFGIYDEPSSPLKLAIFDSKGSASSAKEAISTLVFKNNAVGIVGGVVSQSATELAKEAEKMMVPLILLSQKSGVTQAGPYVFQNAVTANQLTKSLVAHLIKEGHSKFSILYPNDPYGVEYANLFWNYVEESGGEVRGVQTYKPKETDFNGSIQRLTGTYYVEDRDEEYREILKEIVLEQKKRRQKIKFLDLLPPVVDFSVLFIPDSLKSVSRIAPYLKFRGVENVILAGTNLWNVPEVLRNKKALEGVIFVDALTVRHPQFKSSKFFKHFYSTFGYKPSLFELLSYEAALALRQELVSGRSSREELRDGLATIEELASPVGKINITKTREFIRPSVNLTVKDGQIVSTNP